MIKYFLFFVLFISSVFSQNFNRIEKLLKNANGLTKSSILFINAENGKVIYSQNPENLLTPASLVKIFTTASILDLLGNNFTLQTKLFSQDYNFTDSKIDGDLFIKTFADPFLTVEKIDTLISTLKTLGITKVTGNIIVDETYFDENYNRNGWIKNEKSNIVIPPISSSILNRNEVNVTFSPNKNAYNISYYPQSEFWRTNFNAKITSKKKIPTLEMTTTKQEFNVSISGNVRKRNREFSYKLFVDNPSLFLANIFFERLKENKIVVLGKPKLGKITNEVIEIASISELISKTLKEMNKESDNFIAEVMFKILGAEFSKEQGNSFYSIQAVNTFLDKIGIDYSQIEIVDGSGISRFNKLNAKTISLLLQYIYKNKAFFNQFYNYLSVAGEDGTLFDRLNGFGLKNNFHGKTGTLNGVSALAGFFTTKKSTNVIAVILFEFNKNGANYFRDIQDNLVVEISESF